MSINNEAVARELIRPIYEDEEKYFDYNNIINIYPIETIKSDLHDHKHGLYFFKVMDNFGLYGCSKIYKELEECEADFDRFLVVHLKKSGGSGEPDGCENSIAWQINNG